MRSTIVMRDDPFMARARPVLGSPRLGAMSFGLLARSVVAAAVVSGGVADAAQMGAPPPPQHRLSGRLVLVEKGRPAVERGLDRSRAAVWFEPARRTAAPAAVDAEMATLKKQFTPQLVVVPVGSRVGFPNRDPILHNVFSVSGKNSFDLGLVGAGQGKSFTFREPGLVRVFCNVHHGMFAHVLVVGTPHFAVADARGGFALAGLPPGPGTLHFWHERGEPASRKIVVPHPGELELELSLVLPRVPPHKNKFGKAYGRGAYD
jgi:plastocyanin